MEGEQHGVVARRAAIGSGRRINGVIGTGLNNLHQIARARVACQRRHTVIIDQWSGVIQFHLDDRAACRARHDDQRRNADQKLCEYPFHGPCNGTWYGTGFVQTRFVLRLRLSIKNADPDWSCCVATLASALNHSEFALLYHTRMSKSWSAGSKNSRLSEVCRLAPPVIALVRPLALKLTGCGYVELATVYPLLCTAWVSAVVGTKPGIYSVCAPCPARMVTIKPLVG